MFGDYPSSMRNRVGSRLPRFTSSEAALLKGSLDFVGINHYTTFYAQRNATNLIGVVLNDSLADAGALTIRKSKEPPIWDFKASNVQEAYKFCSKNIRNKGANR